MKDDSKYKGTLSIIPPLKSGQWANCWENITKLFYTLVLILSVDYKEQLVSISTLFMLFNFWCSRCVMSLTQGVMNNFPCPICMIPEHKLSSIMPHTYTLCTSQATNILLTEASAERHKGQQEAILKSQSIYDVIIWSYFISCIVTILLDYF